ncbi:hypothetical protein [Streptomyces sp. NPDC056948]|uniref:hypothetical protein n=1 Tax=Streptomyces sp. NPDC056948 TaxID=3345975 RepID=UPI003640A811
MPHPRLLTAGAGVLLSLLCLWLLSGAVPARAAGGEEGGDRTGKLTVEIGWDAARQEVVVRERCAYTLLPDSQALAEIREEGAGFCDGYTVLRDGKAPVDHDGWDNPADTVTQESSRSPARVRTEFATFLARRSGSQRLNISVDMPSAFKEAPAGLPDVWTVEVRAPRWLFHQIRGPVESQSPGTVTWRVQNVSQDDIPRSVELWRTVDTTKPPSTRVQTKTELVTAFALAVCGIGVVAALLVARLAGPAVPRRWATAAMGLTVVAYPLAFVGIPQPTTSNTVVIPFFLSFGGGTPPGQVWTPGPVLGLWLWYVLPVAGWWFSCRLITRKPPSYRVLVVSAVSPLLAFPLMAAGGTEPNLGAWLAPAFAGIAALASLLVLRALNESGAARRWAPTAGALLWVACAAHWLGNAPIMSDRDSVTTWPEAAAVLVCTWPAAAWITSMLGPVLGRAVKPVIRALCFVVLWAWMLSPFLVARATDRPNRGMDPWNYYRGPFFTGYMGFPLCVVLICGVALQIVCLLRRGGLGDRCRALEPIGRILLVCGVLMALGSPSLRTLSMWGDALAILWAGLGSLLLLPVGADATAAELRSIGREDHARFMGRWVETQLIWDTRADFQRAARSALAEDMSVSDFSQRWKELDVPGRRGDPAARLARAKRFALGSSGGTAPRTAGLVGAAIAQLLALPWAGYQLMTGDAVGADGFMPFHLDEISKALRFGHWALYGFVFGYFYALLRGNTPIGKAAMLTVVVLPAEVLSMITLTIDPQYARNPSWTDMAVACGGLAGQTFVVCMGMGLCWEWWLARAAALKWSQVRNFRRLSSITVPLGTVLVAAATAFATVVAGAWAQQELQPPSGSPPSSAPVAPAQRAP